MGITYGDHLIDSGYYDITPEQEREIEAREECARRGIDPDAECADGGVVAWMVVDQERIERPREPVAVKPLEWAFGPVQTSPQLTVWNAEATGMDFTYSIWHTTNPDATAPYTLSRIHNGFFQSLEAAQAAAQADYERRIRSALTTPPVPPTKGPEDDLIAAREAAEDIEINYVVCDPKEVREQVAAAIVDALRKDRALRSRPLGAAVSGGRPWGVHTIASMFSPNNYAGLPDGRYVRSVAEPYRGNRAISAWWVLTGRAHAVVWPNAGDLEAAIEKDERP